MFHSNPIIVDARAFSGQQSMASVAAKVLLDAGLMERCLVLLQAILQHWKSSGGEETPVVAGLLKRPLTSVSIQSFLIGLPPDWAINSY